MLRGKGLVIFFIALAVGGSCSKSDQVRIADQMYFPLRVGSYFIYQVKEKDIQNQTCDTLLSPYKSYQLKALIYDSIKNPGGGYNYLIHRYTRPDSTQPWTNLDTWTARMTTNKVIVTEGNTSYVKFTFPLNNNIQWNGNEYNDQPEEDYTLQKVGQPYQFGNGTKYPATLTVVQSDNQDYYVYYDKRLEVYAATVGLVYKETTQYTYFQDVNCYGQQKVKTGVSYTQSLVKYGSE